MHGPRGQEHVVPFVGIFEDRPGAVGHEEHVVGSVSQRRQRYGRRRRVTLSFGQIARVRKRTQEHIGANVETIVGRQIQTIDPRSLSETQPGVAHRPGGLQSTGGDGHAGDIEPCGEKVGSGA